jgi:hypothetical protein
MRETRRFEKQEMPEYQGISCYHLAEKPPTIGITCPVILLAGSEARKRTVGDVRRADQVPLNVITDRDTSFSLVPIEV